MQKSIILFLVLLSNSVSYSQAQKCNILKNCKLKYADIFPGNILTNILIKNDKHIEYSEDEKYFIKSNLVWVNECEYNATITEYNVVNYPFKIGDTMNVKFDKFENDIVYYIAVYKEKEIKGKMIILK
jgi:hypothetical protein